MRLRSLSLPIFMLILTTIALTAQEPEKSKNPPLPKLDHMDIQLVEPTINPCDNFYQYSCAKHNQANPIPPDQMAWGVAGKLYEWNETVLRTILEEEQAPRSSRSANEQKIGDFYASCMTESASGKAALKPIESLLARIDAIKSKQELGEVLAQIHLAFGGAWQGGDNQTNVALFGYGPTADYEDVSRMVAGLDQGGLGMPGRDFYLTEDAASKTIRDKYLAYIATLLTLAGASDAEAHKQAQAILDFETQLAKAQMDNITRRDPTKANNRLTLAQVKALTPSFDWEAYLRALQAPAVPLYEVSYPAFFRAVETQIHQQELATWKYYLRWQLLNQASAYLGPDWRSANFEFHRKTLLGAKEQSPDWRRCTGSTDRYLGQALGQIYVTRAFPPRE